MPRGQAGQWAATQPGLMELSEDKVRVRVRMVKVKVRVRVRVSPDRPHGGQLFLWYTMVLLLCKWPIVFFVASTIHDTVNLFQRAR